MNKNVYVEKIVPTVDGTAFDVLVKKTNFGKNDIPVSEVIWTYMTEDKRLFDDFYSSDRKRRGEKNAIYLAKRYGTKKIEKLVKLT